MIFRLAIIFTALTLSACSSWVFRYDVPQGNYLEQKSIDKLQVGMTKEQVKFILGSPVVVDPFNNDHWNYVYTLKSGRDSKFNQKKKFILTFVDDKLTAAEGDFTLSDNFNTPFNAPSEQDATSNP
jgi:outer membrane protein assembly factor BamE